MKVFKDYIIEKLKLDGDIKMKEKTKPVYFPENKRSLMMCIDEVLAEKGHDANLNVIDTSKITDMGGLFKEHINDIENIDISEWDVSNVTNMEEMFADCKKFNSDLSEWNVHSLRKAFAMFNNCENFDSDLSNWDVTNLEEAKSMFHNCKKFDSNLSNWDITSLEECEYMFAGAEKFKSNLDTWKPANIRSKGKAAFMFRNSGVKKLPAWYKKLFN